MSPQFNKLSVQDMEQGARDAVLNGEWDKALLYLEAREAMISRSKRRWSEAVSPEQLTLWKEG